MWGDGLRCADGIQTDCYEIHERHESQYDTINPESRNTP